MRIAILILCCLVFRVQAITTNSTPLFKLADVVPEGKHDLEIMTLQYSERAAELTAKFQQATAANKDWFYEYVKNAPDGPLPYDERLGLTKDEYAEYQRELRNRRLVSAGTKVPCLFLLNEDMLSLDIGDPDSPLNKILLNLATDELTASVGVVGKPEWISHDGSSSVMGAYEGAFWSYSKSGSSGDDIRLFKLEIYRLRPSGKILWRIQDGEVLQRKRTKSFDVLFQPVPAAKNLPNATPANVPQHQTSSRLENVFKICGIIWAGTWMASGITALISAVLAFFTRKLRPAFILSLTGVWLGIISVITASIMIWLARSNGGLSSNTNGDNLSLLSMTASAPFLAFIVNRWSRHKLKTIPNITPET